MNLFTLGLTYVVVWWLVLFMVLPFGAAPAEDVQPGHASSAPEKPRMLIKLLITTVIAAGVTAAITALLHSGLISIRPG
jgi:predicted secreted protein